MENSLEDRLWETMFRDGQQFLRAGKLEEAMREFQGALNLSDKFDEDDLRRLKSLNGLALAHCSRQDFARAEPFFERAVTFVERANGADDIEVGRQLKHLALVYGNQRKFDSAEKTYIRAIAIIEKHAPGHPDLETLRAQLERVRKQKQQPSKPPEDELVVIMNPRRKERKVEDEGNGNSSGSRASHPTPSPGTAPVPNDNPVGRVLDNRYEVLQRIAAGGMSVIYKARHSHLDRVVAVKIMHPHLMKLERNTQRFTQEAKLASNLVHQNIVTVRDFGVTSDGLCYIVMDYVQGETLSERINRQHHLQPEQFLEFAKQIADALIYAHEMGLLHRDLKPSNIMIDTTGPREIAKIVDFGIAKLVSKGEEDLSLTQTGETVGSPLYMSPEQCRGRSLDIRSDIYSFGCLAYKSLTGFPPFLGSTDIDVYFRHINDAPRPMKETYPNVNIPPDLESIVMQCLQKDPLARQQTMRDVRKQLDGV